MLEEPRPWQLHTYALKREDPATLLGTGTHCRSTIEYAHVA